MREDPLSSADSRWVYAMVRRCRYSALGSVVRGIIHNVNGSLQVLSMNVELLQKLLDSRGGEDDPKICNRINACLQQVDKMRGLCDVLSQKTIHDESETPQPIHLNDLLEEYIALPHLNLASTHAVKVIKMFSQRLPALQGASIDFHEGIGGLILNALEAMERSPDKELTLMTTSSGQEVSVAVKDTGCGISKEIEPFLFTPFFTTKGAKHDGLGLTISRSILTPYGASISYTSQPGETLFSVTFPLHRAHQKH